MGIPLPYHKVHNIPYKSNNRKHSKLYSHLFCFVRHTHTQTHTHTHTHTNTHTQTQVCAPISQPKLAHTNPKTKPSKYWCSLPFHQFNKMSKAFDSRVANEWTICLIPPEGWSYITHLWVGGWTCTYVLSEWVDVHIGYVLSGWVDVHICTEWVGGRAHRLCAEWVGGRARIWLGDFT